jgi:signal transduction histidine kinase
MNNNHTNTRTILTQEIRFENDVVSARGRARQIAAGLGFDEQDQTRIATAVSEIARNAFRYAGGGKVEYLIEGETPPQRFVVRISDQGPGITDVNAILEGRYRSLTGLGLGISGARRLMDALELASIPGKGTTVGLKKNLPSRLPVITAQDFDRIATELVRLPTTSVYEVLQQQNRELLSAMDSLRQRQEELVRLNREMEETNRGVVALYAELDEKSRHLKQAYDQKSAFLANMGHELRTPLNSITALSRLLLERADGELTPEQEKQVRFIRKAVDDLSELINDLLDLAKMEAGKVVIKPEDFEVAALFGTLRGLFRPLLQDSNVALIFEESKGIPPLNTDEGKTAQILRNIISNAIKYTEKGEVRISAALTPDQRSVIFNVTDTGIGIPTEDQERIFQPFIQVDHSLQKKIKGTGLGLSLAKNLAELLGGGIFLKSEPGKGSAFSVAVPRNYAEKVEAMPDIPLKSLESPFIITAHPPGERRIGAPDRRLSKRRVRVKNRRKDEIRYGVKPGNDIKAEKVLIIDDNEADRYRLTTYLRDMPVAVIEAINGREGLRLAHEERPQAVIMDLIMPEMDGFQFLANLKADPETRDIPVIIMTSKELSEAEHRQLAAGALAIFNKAAASRNEVVEKVREALKLG